MLQRPRLGVNILPNGTILMGGQEVHFIEKTHPDGKETYRVGFRDEPKKLLNWEAVLEQKQ